MIEGTEPAFPLIDYSYGLTIRQHFAAMAMQGIKSNNELCRICDKAALKFNISQANAIAEMAVKDADALIEELNKQK